MVTRRGFLTAAAACASGMIWAAQGHAARTSAAPLGRAGPHNALPEGACDCHVHVVGDPAVYPMIPDRPYTPPPASVADLKTHLADLGLSRVVLVQPSFYGTDNRCLLHALSALAGRARGVAVIADDTGDDELAALDAAGIRGVRINLKSTGINEANAALDGLAALAARIRPLDWHIQIYAALPVVAVIAPRLSGLGVPVVFDHYAMAQAADGADQADLAPVLDAVHAGQAYIKLSAPYRIAADGPDYARAKPIARAFIRANPHRMLWASDWPHTNRIPGRAPQEITPYRQIDDEAVLKRFLQGLDAETRRRILVDNPARLYRF